MNVESVVFISATQSELYFLTGTSALLLARKAHLTRKKILLISCLLFLSIMTKETGFLFLLLVILYRYIFKLNKIKEFTISGVVITSIYLCLRVFLGGVTYIKKLEVPIAGLSLTQRLLNIPLIILYYLKTFIFPIKLAIWQQWVVKTISFQYVIAPLIICLALIAGFIYFTYYVYKYDPRHIKKATHKLLPQFIFFSLWFVVGIGMLLQLVPLDMTVSDRWFYFPIVGLLGLIGTGIQLVKASSTKGNKMLTWSLGIILIILLSARTIVRNTNWTDGFTLFTHDSTISDNYEIENNIGVEYSANQQNYTEALKHFKKSDNLFPSYADTAFNIGYAYEHMGNFAEAEKYYLKSLDETKYPQSSDRNQQEYEAVGAMLTMHGDSPITPSTTVFLKKALRLYPNSGKLWVHLAYAEYELHNQEEAVYAAKKANTILAFPETNYLYLQILNREPVDLNQL